MAAKDDIIFIDNPLIAGHESRYANVTVDLRAVVKSWKQSLFSFEWMTPDGAIKTPDELSDREREKRAAVEARIGTGQPLFRPVLGIGIMDNIEIGSGREILLTMAARGAIQIPVHIPAGNMNDFKSFLVQVS